MRVQGHFCLAGKRKVASFAPAGRSVPDMFNLIIILAMEYINKIELRGRVGRSDVQVYGNSRLCRFSVITEYGYRDRSREPVIDSTWFNVSLWDSKGNMDFSFITQGAIVDVVGRVRTYRYNDSDGQEHSSWDIQAWKCKNVVNEDNEPIVPQSNLIVQ